MDAVIESKRVRDFRIFIANQIPKFPNNKETLQLLQSKSLASLLVDYINWAHRFIPIRPREVSIEPSLTVDSRWRALKGDTNIILEKARRGEDLNPHISLRVSKNGFTPRASSTAAGTDRWEDKDFLLNVMGYDHLHLSNFIEPAGHSQRTDDVLFVQITRSSFNAIGYFNHTVFETADTAVTSMTSERARLWELFNRRNELGIPQGSICVEAPIMTSGHTMRHVRRARQYANTIYETEPKLDDLDWRAKVFRNRSSDELRKMKLTWHLNFLDLVLLEKNARKFLVLEFGPT